MSQDRPNGEAVGRRAPDAALPLFFRRLVALDLAAHAGLKLDRAKGGYGFAAAANALPLAASEFAAAAVHYPIVFAGTGPAAAVAVVGSRDGQNLFVDRAGAWRPGKYIPAYARAYPFILLEIAGGDRLVLAADPDAESLGADTGAALFEGGKAAAALDEALRFCRTLHEDLKQALAFGAALDAAGLLVPNQATITLRSGASLRLAGFKVIDRAKFDALDDAQFLDWRRRGWLALVYCHFLSTAQWAGIVELTGADAPAAQAR